MGCLFEYELDKMQCVYWNDDCCREPEINCGNGDALCNQKINEHTFGGEEYIKGRADVTEELKEKIDRVLDYLKGQKPEEARKILEAVRKLLD